MTWDIEVIRYDSKGKKVIEHDLIFADGHKVDDHNNLILYTNAVDEYGLNEVKTYHGYNWISIQPAK